MNTEQPNNATPETEPSREGFVTSSDLVGSGGNATTEVNGGAGNVWIQGAALRWKRERSDRNPIAALMGAMGALPPVLQQAWTEQMTGRVEWRDVPTEEEEEPTESSSETGSP
jgi:hypothetical protein